MKYSRFVVLAILLVACTRSDPVSVVLRDSANKPATATDRENQLQPNSHPANKLVVTQDKVKGRREALYDIGILRKRDVIHTQETTNSPITPISLSVGGSAENRSRPMFPRYWPLLETATENSVGTDPRFAGLAECWFYGSSGWMFSREDEGEATVEINGQGYQMFTEGIRTIVYSGRLGQCFADIVGLSWQRGWERLHDEGDNVFAELTNGVGLYGSRMNAQRPFGYYNAELISWGIQNLMPEKDATVGGVPFQLVYDVVLSRFARLTAEIYLNLAGKGDIASQAFQYNRLSEASSGSSYGDEEYFDGPMYLARTFSRRNDRDSAFYIPRQEYYIRGASWRESDAFGFWLRRYIDGTHDELWVGLKMLLKRFDPDFLDKITSFVTTHGESRGSAQFNFPSLSTVVESEIKQDLRFAELASCWFSDAPGYAFGQYGESETKISIGNQEYQTFDQGIVTLFYGGQGLSRCLSEIVNRRWDKNRDRLHSYGEGTISMLSDGLSLYGKKMHDNQPFGYYNPAIISWGVQTLLPDRDDTVGGAPIQLVYDIVFARFVRMMAETYLDLKREGDLADEAFRYKELAEAGWDVSRGDDKYFYAPSYFADRFGQRQTIPSAEYHMRYANWDLPTSYGFWLRRYLDGTHDELWMGLEILLHRFDPDFLEQITAEYL